MSKPSTATHHAGHDTAHQAAHDVVHPAPGAARPKVNYDQRPMLVFWETTRACALACRHCRASATLDALPGELTTQEGFRLVEQVAGFGRPHPILVLTGGDCLMRPDLFEIVEHARALGVPTALSPSVTPMLTPDMVERIAASGVKAVSISLDGATGDTHDGVRGIPGHFAKTLDAIDAFVAAGLTVQINTTVMRTNVHELPDVAAILADHGAHIWEVFFLVHVGRGTDTASLDPQQHEDVCHFLWDASHHGFTVRTVEAPFFRRVAAARRAGGEPPSTALYADLGRRLRERLGEPGATPRAHTVSTRDGKGIVFVAYDGTVHPAGFLPLVVGDVRSQDLATIYRDHPTLKAVRAAGFSGRCGGCEYADLCGGSRARAFASSGDPLAEDPACAYVPTGAPVPA